MKLNEILKGQLVVVTAVNAGRELKNRFSSFGLVKGAVIYIEGHSLARKTMDIRINKTHIALRSSEAETIEVD